MADTRYVIAGLGNPGRQYEKNRHNIGFMAVDLLAMRHGLRFDKMMHRGLVALGEIKGAKVALVKPQTYMNASGESVAPLLRFYKSETEQLMVLYDELDIPSGQIRMRKFGSAGGHNGMKSIIQHLSSQDFPRTRLGIGRPPGSMDPAAYVLQDFDRGELPSVEALLDKAVLGVEIWLTDGVDLAMNRVNGTERE